VKPGFIETLRDRRTAAFMPSRVCHVRRAPLAIAIAWE